MKVTGYKLREALRNLELRREAVARDFQESLVVFPEEEGKRKGPEELADSLVRLERDIARLQAAQTEYNTKVKVSVLGEAMTLAQAVKTVGGATRAIQLWKGASDVLDALRGQSSYSRVQRKDEVVTVAKAMVTREQIVEKTIKAEKFAAALKGAIAEGNGALADIELDVTL